MPKPDFEFNAIPQAYFLTFRGYGTWLHGDKRGSIDRDHNRFGTSRLLPNERRRQLNLGRLKNKPARLAPKAREAVEAAVRETCKDRKWGLWVVNARTNHVHVVVTAPGKPEPVLAALKAKATKKLRGPATVDLLKVFGRRGEARSTNGPSRMLFTRSSTFSTNRVISRRSLHKIRTGSTATSQKLKLPKHALLYLKAFHIESLAGRCAPSSDFV